MRCRCGEPVEVPEAKAIEIDDAEFDREISAPPLPIPVAAFAEAPLDYQAISQPADQELTPVGLGRDVVVPCAVLLAGVFGFSFAVASTHNASPAICLMRAWILISVTALPPMLAFIGYGLIAARRLRLTLGAFFIASLKLLAVLIATDAVIMTVTTFGGFRWDPAHLLTCFGWAAAVTAGLGFGLFGSSRDPFRRAGLLVGILVWITHFLLLIFVISLLSSFINSRRPVVNSFAVSGAGPGRSRLQASSGMTDRQVTNAAAKGFEVREGREWKAMRYGNTSDADILIEGLYGSGANKVYVDLRFGGIVRPAVAYVELPSDPVRVAKCLAAYQAYLDTAQLPPRTVTPSTTQRFTTFPLR